MWIIPIITLLYNGIARLVNMGADMENLFMAVIYYGTGLLFMVIGNYLPKVKQRTLVSELVPKLLNVGEIQKVLQNLLAEGISIRDLVTIFETLQSVPQRPEASKNRNTGIPWVFRKHTYRMSRIKSQHRFPSGFLVGR